MDRHSHYQQDYAITGAPYPENLLTAAGYTLVPIIAQALVPIYNLPSVTDLVLAPLNFLIFLKLKKLNLI